MVVVEKKGGRPSTRRVKGEQRAQAKALARQHKLEKKEAQKTLKKEAHMLKLQQAKQQRQTKKTNNEESEEGVYAHLSTAFPSTIGMFANVYVAQVAALTPAQRKDPQRGGAVTAEAGAAAAAAGRSLKARRMPKMFSKGRAKAAAATASAPASAGAATEGAGAGAGTYAELTRLYPTTVNLFSTALTPATHETSPPSVQSAAPALSEAVQPAAPGEGKAPRAAERPAEFAVAGAGAPAARNHRRFFRMFSPKQHKVKAPPADDDGTYAQLTQQYPTTVNLFSGPVAPQRACGRDVGPASLQEAPALAEQEPTEQVPAVDAQPAYATLTTAYPSTVGMFSSPLMPQAAPQPTPSEATMPAKAAASRRRLRLPAMPKIFRTKNRSQAGASESAAADTVVVSGLAGEEDSAYADLTRNFPSTVNLFAFAPRGETPTSTESFTEHEGVVCSMEEVELNETAVAGDVSVPEADEAYATLSTAYPSTIGMFAGPPLTATDAPAAPASGAAAVAEAEPSAAVRAMRRFRARLHVPSLFKGKRRTSAASATSAVASEDAAASEGAAASEETAYAQLTTQYPTTVNLFSGAIASLHASSAPDVEAEAQAVAEEPDVDVVHTDAGEAHADVQAASGAPEADELQARIHPAYASLTTSYPSTVGIFAGPLMTAVPATPADAPVPAKAAVPRRRLRLPDMTRLFRTKRRNQPAAAADLPGDDEVAHPHLAQRFPTTVNLISSPLPPASREEGTDVVVEAEAGHENVVAAAADMSSSEAGSAYASLTQAYPSTVNMFVPVFSTPGSSTADTGMSAQRRQRGRFALHFPRLRLQSKGRAPSEAAAINAPIVLEQTEAEETYSTLTTRYPSTINGVFAGAPLLEVPAHEVVTDKRARKQAEKEMKRWV
jgi:hypothetical protein